MSADYLKKFFDQKEFLNIFLNAFSQIISISTYVLFSRAFTQEYGLSNFGELAYEIAIYSTVMQISSISTVGFHKQLLTNKYNANEEFTKLIILTSVGAILSLFLLRILSLSLMPLFIPILLNIFNFLSLKIDYENKMMIKFIASFFSLGVMILLIHTNPFYAFIAFLFVRVSLLIIFLKINISFKKLTFKLLENVDNVAFLLSSSLNEHVYKIILKPVVGLDALGLFEVSYRLYTAARGFVGSIIHPLIFEVSRNYKEFNLGKLTKYFLYSFLFSLGFYLIPAATSLIYSIELSSNQIMTLVLLSTAYMINTLSSVFFLLIVKIKNYAPIAVINVVSFLVMAGLIIVLKEPFLSFSLGLLFNTALILVFFYNINKKSI